MITGGSKVDEEDAGKKRKGDVCYILSQTPSELCPEFIWKTEFKVENMETDLQRAQSKFLRYNLISPFDNMHYINGFL